jgi:hypothetical protein
MGPGKKNLVCTVPTCGRKTAQLHGVDWFDSKVCNPCRMQKINEKNRAGTASQASTSGISQNSQTSGAQAPSFAHMMICVPSASVENSR